MPPRRAAAGSRGADADWRVVVAVAAVADEANPAVVAAYAGIDRSRVEAAFAIARSEGVLREDGTVDPGTAEELVSSLPAERVGEIHAAAASRLLAAGPDQTDAAIAHARAAGRLVGTGAVVDLVERTARMRLSISSYGEAERLLRLAEELDPAASPAVRTHRIRDLAVAVAGRGDVFGARDLLVHAVDLAEIAGDVDAAVAAVAHIAFPADYWYAGDRRTVAVLGRVAALDLDDDQRTLVTAATAIAEMRIPVTNGVDHQIAWVTRASMAQPLAEQALARSVDAPDPVRLVALRAWRSTHRGPGHLPRRRAASETAVDLAQRTHRDDHQVEASLMLAVDALEAADRSRYREALAVARWVAERDGNPRLRWMVETALAGEALLDGDADRAAAHRASAGTLGRDHGLVAHEAGDGFLEVQVRVADETGTDLAPVAVADDSPLLDALSVRLAVARDLARVGETSRAHHHLERAVRALDDESSVLGAVDLCARVLVLAPEPDVADELVARFGRYVDHVAVDANGWWCFGPFALALAELELAAGRPDRADELLDLALARAQAIDDPRSSVRALRLAATIGYRPPAERREIAAAVGLSEREREILGHVAAGATNPEIARLLAFSPSTIRIDTMSIYRKLGVAGRREAVARARELGILRPAGPEAVPHG